MGCAERTLGAFDRFLTAADRGPDADDLQPFAVRKGRQNGGKSFGGHAFARAGRPGKQYIVPACRRDLERTLDGVLTEYMGEVQRIVLRLGRRRGSARFDRPAAVQMSEQLV